MDKHSRHRTVRLTLSACALVLLWIVGAITANIVKYRPVNQAQKDMIAKIQEAHLLGARKQNVIAFFRQQTIPYSEYYGLMSGGGWEAFLNNEQPASDLGMIIVGSNDKVIARTTGYFGCTKSWSLETRAKFDAKGKVIQVEVRPTYSGCDI
jgi:hypothetical protein